MSVKSLIQRWLPLAFPVRSTAACRRRPQRRWRSSNGFAACEILETKTLLTYQLHGLDVSPYLNGEDPRNGAGQVTEAELRERLTTVSPHTEWIRTFGSTGDLQPAGRLIHELGKKSAVTAWLGDENNSNPVIAAANKAANLASIDSVVAEALAGNVDMVIVGSETLLRDDVSADQLVSYINDVKQRLAGLSPAIPVTTADTYGKLLANPHVIGAVDVVFANFYPFWENAPIESAMASLNQAYDSLKAVAGTKQIIVSETGWPDAGSPRGQAQPSHQNAAAYLLTFVSWARANDVDYFYFEAFDESWKNTSGEGDVGGHWGIWNGNQTLKPDYDRVFNGETVSDNWSFPRTGAPIIDFFALPDNISTNLSAFVVASGTDPDYTVHVNGVTVPAGTVDSVGVFVLPMTLAVGRNDVRVSILGLNGQVVTSALKVVDYQPSLSTAGSRLLYVDVADAPISGTAVIDLDQNAVLGLLPGRHVRGISPDSTEIYMDDRTVVSTRSHQVVRTLPFSQDIPSNGFLVSPKGDRLYSRDEVLDVASNSLLQSLPIDITTGNSYGGAVVPGGPTISSDGVYIYTNRSVVRIDTRDRSTSITGITSAGSFLSDMATSPGGSQLLVSSYSGGGLVEIYDATTHQKMGQLSTSDFSGQIAFLDNSTAVIGMSGNPQNGGGGVYLFDVGNLLSSNKLNIPLADNVETSRQNGEIFVSSGAFGAVSGKRLGVDVLGVDSQRVLALSRTFFLGINRYEIGYGSPQNDQIRAIIYKSAPRITLLVDQTEIAEKNGKATITATLSEVSSLNVTVDLAFTGTATYLSDYTRSASQIVIPAGSTVGAVTLTAVQDALGEYNENIIVKISGVTNGSEFGTQQATTTIIDDDAPSQAPVITNPVKITPEQRPALSWNSVPGATGYEFRVTKYPSASPFLQKTVTGTSYTPVSDFGIGKFDLAVRGTNSVGPGPLSPNYTFVINTPAVMHSIPRMQPTLRPTISWDALPGAVKYDVWINDVSRGIDQKIRNINVIGTSFTPSVDLPLGVYRAWVRGIAADGTVAAWSGMTEFVTMQAPTITQGQNSTFDRTPTFAWNLLPGAATYEVFIRNRNTGETTLYEKNITSLSFTPSAPLPDGPYRWWAIGMSAQGVRSFWTAPKDIYIGGRTDLLAPVGSSSNKTPTFIWRPVDGAARYDLFVNMDGGKNQIIREQNLTGTSYTQGTQLSSGSFRAWIRAVSTSGEVGPWSLVQVFTIAASTATDDDTAEPVGVPSKLLAVLTTEGEDELLSSDIFKASRQVEVAVRPSAPALIRNFHGGQPTSLPAEPELVPSEDVDSYLVVMGIDELCWLTDFEA